MYRIVERFQLYQPLCLLRLIFITYPCKSFEVEVRPALHLSLDY